MQNLNKRIERSKIKMKVLTKNRINLPKGQDLLNIPLSKCLTGLLYNQRSSSKKNGENRGDVFRTQLNIYDGAFL